jgi:hypothetical protein
MERPNLLLKFKLKGESEFNIEQASRIKIDGRGYLLVYEDAAVTPKWIFLDGIRAFSIESLPQVAQVSDSLRPANVHRRAFFTQVAKVHVTTP